MFHEKHSRTIFKSLTWRIIAFISSIIALYMLTNDLKIAINHSIIIHSVKIFLYYFHERIWNLSSFGQELKSKTI